jgi:uncharacterized membrane protein
MSVSNVARIAGLGVAAVGLSHFVKPTLFESITTPAFPRRTRQHIYTNGAIETAIGFGLISPKTRKAALVGTLAYGAYLGVNAARNRS